MTDLRTIEELRSSRPLDDAKAPEWRRYADALEAELAASGQQDTGLTLWGIRVVADPDMPEGRYELRKDGHTYVTGRLSKPFHDDPDSADMRVLQTLLRAINKMRLAYYMEPTELVVHRDAKNPAGHPKVAETNEPKETSDGR